jgi:hypothetical protein
MYACETGGGRGAVTVAGWAGGIVACALGGCTRTEPHFAQNCAPTENGVPHLVQKPAAIKRGEKAIET